MPLLDAFKEISLLDEPLAPYTWMKVGGPAQFLVRPRQPDELQEVVRFCHDEQIPVRVLGGGSNILVRDEGVSGAVLQLVDDSFAQITVGGALRGNAGGRSGDIGQFVESVTVMSAKGEISTRKGNDLWFGYRETNIDELLILEATFALQPGDTQEITRRMRKLWIMKKATQPLSFQC